MKRKRRRAFDGNTRRKRFCSNPTETRPTVKKSVSLEEDEDFFNPLCNPSFFLDFHNMVDDELAPLNFKYITSHVWHASYPRPKYDENLAAAKTPCINCSCATLKDIADGFIDSERSFSLKPFGLLPTTIVECNQFCPCDPNVCKNRLLQRKRKHKLDLVVVKTKGKGWGIRTRQKILKGSFVCEYVGEVISEAEADKRGTEYDKSKLSYLWTQGGELPGGTIDATHYGNIARFANHSCDPNCFAVEVLVECRQTSHHPRIAFFAGRDIQLGEEISIDYSYSLDHSEDYAIECKCGSIVCRGRIR